MINRVKLGYPLIVWALICLLPIPLAALFPTNICSIIYLFLWLFTTFIFGRILTVISSVNKSLRHSPVEFGCFLLILYYGVKIVLLGFQILGYGNLLVIQYVGLFDSLFLWIGLLIFFSHIKMKVTGVLFTISGFSMSIPSLLTYASSIGIINWERFAFLTPIFSLLYFLGFIISAISCIRWIKKNPKYGVDHCQ